MAPFLTDTWDTTAENWGFQATAEATAAVRKANCKLFLCHLASFLKVPYYSMAIQTRTTSLESVWELLRKVYNVEKSVRHHDLHRRHAIK